MGVCSNCNGSGYKYDMMRGSYKCPSCKGTGHRGRTPNGGEKPRRNPFDNM